MDDQMQRDTDAGFAAWMVDNASDREWVRFTTLLLTAK